ncbi:MAG: hypothetical protein ACK5SX_05585 [Sandaracinobacter sp.]
MRLALMLISAVSLMAAAPSNAEQPNQLTQGMVQMTLKVGETMQLEVLEKLGAPNITTLDAQGREVWVYDRQATVSANSNSSFSIGLLFGGAGGGVGGGAGTGFGKSKSKNEQTQRTMTLIIKFDETKKVADFKSRSSSF